MSRGCSRRLPHSTSSSGSESRSTSVPLNVFYFPYVPVSRGETVPGAAEECPPSSLSFDAQKHQVRVTRRLARWGLRLRGQSAPSPPALAGPESLHAGTAALRVRVREASACGGVRPARGAPRGLRGAGTHRPRRSPWWGAHGRMPRCSARPLFTAHVSHHSGRGSHPAELSGEIPPGLSSRLWRGP